MDPRLLVIAGFLLGPWACSDRPSREKFPGAEGRTTEVQQSQTEKAVLGGFDSLNSPFLAANQNGQDAKKGDGENKPGQTLHGVVEIGKNVKLHEGMYFFLSVKHPEGGPPMAARREMRPDFPYEFTLSAADSMIAGTPFEGDVVVTARLKQDSDPLSRQKGDYSGVVHTKVGDQKVKVLIDQED